MAERTVGVVGAGVMGAGLAQSLAEAGHRVVLVDVSQEALERALGEVRRGVAARRLFAKGGPAPDPSEVLGRVQPTTDHEDLGGATFVIENVPERVELKKQVWGRLDTICPPDAVLAANTSCVPIGSLAACTTRPGRVIGIHFMNPVPMKATVEVIRAEATTEETLTETLELLATMGKDAVVVGDAPGFVSNRVLMLTINEAVAVLDSGIASPADVDRVFTACFGHAMGPLATADLIGLDTIHDSLVVLRDELGSDRFEPHRLLVEMVGRGELGRKTGRGFHAYGTR